MTPITKDKSIGRGSTAIDIFSSDLVTELKDRAGKEGKSLRVYVNDQLELMVKKEQYLEKVLPALKKLAFEEGYLFIWDAKKRITCTIGRKDDIVFCEQCKSSECVHSMYALMMPEVGVLAQNKNE